MTVYKLITKTQKKLCLITGNVILKLYLVEILQLLLDFVLQTLDHTGDS